MDRLAEERIDDFKRARRCQIRLVGYVCSPRALERRPPGVAVLPVKARPGVTRTNSQAAPRLPEPIRHPAAGLAGAAENRSEEHTSELQSHSDLVCRLLLDKTKLHPLDM